MLQTNLKWTQSSSPLGEEQRGANRPSRPPPARRRLCAPGSAAMLDRRTVLHSVSIVSVIVSFLQCFFRGLFVVFTTNEWDYFGESIIRGAARVCAICWCFWAAKRHQSQCKHGWTSTMACSSHRRASKELHPHSLISNLTYSIFSSYLGVLTNSYDIHNFFPKILSVEINE